MRAVFGGIAATLAVAAFALAPASAVAAPNTCPPIPPPGSTVGGGLVVPTGQVCILSHVNVSGGITVQTNAHLELEDSAVSGGITVEPGGELDSGHTVNSGVSTYNPSSISGGINWLHGFDLDLDNATVSGGVNIVGPIAAGSVDSPTICGSTINSSLNISDINGAQSFEPELFGDPGEPFEAGPHTDCPANTITGSVQIRNTSDIEMEGNNIAGSAQLYSSQIDFWDNTVGGSLQCDSTSTLTNHDGDPTANTVKGGNSCS